MKEAIIVTHANAYISKEVEKTQDKKNAVVPLNEALNSVSILTKIGGNKKNNKISL